MNELALRRVAAAIGRAPLHGGLLLVLGCAACSGEQGAAPSSEAVARECEGRADTYAPGLSKASDDGAVSVEIGAVEPPPPASAEALWKITLRDATETPLEAASIVAIPYMPDHGHTAVTRIARDTGGGRYELGPLALIMPGLWEVTLRIAPSGGEQSDVIFWFCIGA